MAKKKVTTKKKSSDKKVAKKATKKKVAKKVAKKTTKTLNTKIYQEKKSGKIKAQINSDKSVHEFELTGLSDYQSSILEKIQLEEREGIEKSIIFLRLLSSKNFDFSDCIVSYDQNVYRVCPRKRNPLDTTGSVINGGRHHVGGPQQNVLFPAVTIFFALYTACELDTAIDEYKYYLGGMPLGPGDKGFELKIKKNLKIFDLDKIIQKVDNPILTTNVSDSPVWGEWKYQKFPHITQLVSFWIYDKFDADGLLFSSTKCEDGKNLALFFDTNLPSIVKDKVVSEKEVPLP